jgi:hypothetical protein
MLHNKLERWGNEVRGSGSCKFYGHASCDDTTMSIVPDNRLGLDCSIQLDEKVTSVV